jgi:hypothetical protein
MGAREALAGFLAGVAIGGCGKTVPLDENTACPCAPGWTCFGTVCLAAQRGKVIDDMRTSKTPTGSSWYTYSDRTCPLSCPPRFTSGYVGTLVPGDGQPFLPRGHGGGPPIDGGPWAYREVSGGGEDQWGVGFGFDLKDEPGPSPLAACRSDGGTNACTGTPLEAGGDTRGLCKDGYYISQPVLTDEHKHLGFTFWAQSLDENPVQLTVLVSDVHTAYNGRHEYPTEPHVCDPCLSGGVGACGDDFALPVDLTLDWKQFVVLFSQLGQAGWSHEHGKGSPPPPALDTTRLGHINFEIQTEKGAHLKPFSVRVAYVEWIDL